MQRIEMTAEYREKSGKGAARSIRRAGKIPAVLYGEGHSLPLTLDPADILHVLHSGAGENALITLKLRGTKQDGERLTILRDFQLDPVTGKLLHADLFEVSLNKAIRVRVHIELIGEAPVGVKEGGVLQHTMREVEVECLPTSIPDRLEVDASQLKIGDAIHIRDLEVGEGVRVLGQPDQVVVSVAAPISEAKLEELLTTKEAKEPEVITKGKEEAEEGAKAEAKGPEPAPAAVGGAKAKKEEEKKKG